MGTEKEALYQLLEEIKKEIDDNERADGTYVFDVRRMLVALDFAKREMQNSVDSAESIDK